MMKREQIRRLREAGLTQERVSKVSEVSQRSVRRVEKERPALSMDDVVERKARGIGRPSPAAAYRDQVEAILEQEPGVKTVEILSRLRTAGYGGSKSPVYELVAGLRQSKVEPLMVRFEGLAGEFSQHDFGQVDVRFTCGRVKRVHFFATRMKYSRWTEVSLVADQQVESLIRALVDHFASIGGIPLLAVFDRPKTIAIKWGGDGKVSQWNPSFSAVVMELGLGVELCWPYSPQQKGSVENLVGWVKNSFFRQRRFVDEEDLHNQLHHWLEEINTRRPSRATGEIPQVRLEQERTRLRPLSVSPADLAIRVPVRVGPTAMVRYGGQLYSMPPDTISLSATLMLYRDRVRIVAQRHDVVHPRLQLPGQKSCLPEHRAQAIAAVSGQRGRRYYKREQLIGLGEVALEYITELVHRRPRTWATDIDSLYRNLELHGDQAMCGAFAQGLEQQVIGAEYVCYFLSQQPQHFAQGEFLK
jgi:transposase